MAITPPAKSNAKVFEEHLRKYGLVGFGGYKIKTLLDDKGQLKKKVGIGLKDWTDVITPESYTNFLMSRYTDTKTGKETLSQPQSYYIKTGSDVGYLGIDFDTQVSYDAFIKSNPECSQYFTQKMRKGYHIVFNYDERFSHSCENTAHPKEEGKIDFRSNGGCLISYPTKYSHHDTGEVYSYTIHMTHTTPL